MGIVRVGAASFGCVLGVAVTCASAGGQEREAQAGFYLVLAEGPTADALPQPTSVQRVVRYDYGFLLPEERQPAKYLLLAKDPDVALLLTKLPEKQKGSSGRTELLFEASEQAAAALAKLTQEHLGQQVAFAIGADVVSTHTIRSVISDGKFRMSRCTDNACEYIYGRLAGR